MFIEVYAYQEKYKKNVDTCTQIVSLPYISSIHLLHKKYIYNVSKDLLIQEILEKKNDQHCIFCVF